MLSARITLEEPEVQRRIRHCVLTSVKQQLERLQPHFSALEFPDQLSVMVAVINMTSAIMTGEKPVHNFIN